MKYKLTPQLRLIKAPVILVLEGNEKQYSSGEELKDLSHLLIMMPLLKISAI